MNTSILAIVVGIVIFIGFQMILPFPYGIIFGLIFVGMIIWYAKKHAPVGKDSLLNYRRTDPISEKEKDQNDEAQRILEKKHIEEKITKEEYKKRKKEFEDTEYNPRKCEVCGSEDFEFISDRRIEEPGEPISDEGYYRCKKCGEK
jgi:flagellar biosynthesis component FlhA